MVNFQKPICFKVTMATARKSTGVVYPVIISLIVFGWGLLLTKHHKLRCLSLCHLNDYQHHNLSLSILPLIHSRANKQRNETLNQQSSKP